MFILANMWFQTLMRQFFFNIDKIVFNFIPTIYDFLITIARTSILSQADIIDMADRVYKLLAVFMVFKVTFSLIMYVVNPDDFSDKSKGVGKLTTNIIISLSLLIITPFIFSMAYQLQTIILEDNSLAALIFGETTDNTNQNGFDTAGEKMAYITMVPFFTPNLGIDSLHECAQLTEKDSNDNVKFRDECYDALKKLSDDSDGRFEEQTLKNYKAGVEKSSLGILFRQDMATATVNKNSDYVINYKYLFSTVIGVVIILLLINFCMDVALRSIKLAFLQLIAPIPIISYVDPKSGKDGMFKKWYQMCFKTFLSLFVRLLALYFAVYIISRIDNMVDIVDGSYVTNALVKIAIIIGALMFVKQFPKILEGLGIKLDGDGKFFLNPLKKIENDMIGGKKIAGFIKAAPAAGLAGAAAFGTNLVARKGNIFSATAGALSATGRGLKGAVKGEKFGKNFSNSYSGAMKARTNRADRKELGINALDVTRENLRSKLYIPNDAQKNKAQIEHLNDFTNSGKAVKTRAEGEVDKKLSKITVNGENLGALKNYVDILKNTNTDGMTDAQKMTLSQKIAEAEGKYYAARKQAVNAYVANANNLGKSTITWVDKAGKTQTVKGFDGAFAGAEHDEIVVSNVSKMRQLNSDYGMNQDVNTADIGATIQGAEDETSRIQNSREYRQAELIAQQAQREKSSK